MAEQAQVSWAGVVLEAAHVRRTGDLLEARDGVLTRSGERVAFRVARWDLGTGEGTFEGVRWEEPGCEGPGLGRAERLVVTDAGWRAEGLVVELCPCGEGVLGMEAAQVVSTSPDTAVVRGGWARIGGVRVLPVPWWPLRLREDGLRMDAPSVGYGADGLRLGWTGRYRQGDVEGWAGPEWRAARGLALIGGVNLPGGDLGTRVGFDTAADAWRGSVGGRGALGSGTPRADASAGFAPGGLGWDVDFASDASYADDYATRWTTRGVAWRTSRAWVTYGGLRAWSEVPHDGSSADLLGAGWLLSIGRPGLRLDLLPALTVVGTAEDAALRPALHGAAAWVGSAGLVHVEAAARGEVGWSGAAYARGGAITRAELPFWVEGLGKAQLWVGPRLEGSWEGEPGWWIGPALRGEHVVGRWTSRADLGVGYGAAGWAPRVQVALQRQRLRLRGRWEDDAAEGALSWRFGDSLSIEPDLRFVVLPDLGAAAGLDLRWGSWRTSFGGAWAAPATWSGAELALGWDDGCLRLMLEGAWSPDRAVPDVGLSLGLRR